MKQIEQQIKMCLENCACLGRDAYGEYIDRNTKVLMDLIKSKTTENK
jgi:hypothetical protein